jgi:hypothetical protein
VLRRPKVDLLSKKRDSTYDGDDQARRGAVVRRIRLQRGRVREALPIDALRRQALVEPDIGEAYPEPRHQPSDGGQVREPAEHAASASGDRHVAEEREEGTCDDGDVGETRARCAQENLGRVSGECEAI